MIPSTMSVPYQTPFVTLNCGLLNGNPDKISLIQVGNVHCQRFQYTICDTIVNPSICVRDLGITYDSKLCFYKYIDDIVERAFQRVNLLFRSFVSGNVIILTKC